MSKLLVLSNGAGEDAIASKVLARLPEDLKSSVVCCPLVGPGAALAKDFELVGPRVNPPSEGLFRESWKLALRDLATGVVGGHLAQLKFLKNFRKDVSLTLAVGDLFPVLWAGLSQSGKTLFVGTAKSVYHHPYSWPERWLLRRFVTRSIVRDPATAERLCHQGLNAEFLGNAMMDEIEARGRQLPFEGKGPTVTVFPGSRGEAPGVLAYQLKILEKVALAIQDIQVGVAVAPGTEVEDLVAPAQKAGWSFEAHEGDAHRGTLSKETLRVELLSGVLGDLLCVSELAFGQAGTANEQAAGAGVPVVSYDRRGEKSLRWYRKRQKGLLGDAVKVVLQDPETICRELVSLLLDSQERERRAKIGRERMGPFGGCQRMADAIVTEFT